jgi:hypothetical protein
MAPRPSARPRPWNARSLESRLDADVAQLVERWLPKPKVAGSKPVVRFLQERATDCKGLQIWRIGPKTMGGQHARLGDVLRPRQDSWSHPGRIEWHRIPDFKTTACFASMSCCPPSIAVTCGPPSAWFRVPFVAGDGGTEPALGPLGSRAPTDSHGRHSRSTGPARPLPRAPVNPAVGDAGLEPATSAGGPENRPWDSFPLIASVRMNAAVLAKHKSAETPAAPPSGRALSALARKFAHVLVMRLGRRVVRGVRRVG